MKVLIIGGLGFVGTQVSLALLEKDHQVTVVDLPESQNRIDHRAFRYVSADTTREGIWQDAVARHDAAINLAGVSIFKRWTHAHKELIRTSRVLTTRHLADAVPADKSFTLCSTSAVGYYGWRQDEILTEEAPPGDDFLAGVCRDWEAEASRAREKGARVVITRFGIVLGRNGGALGQMIPAFRLFVGGPLGSGRQWFSWIHGQDLVRAFAFVLADDRVQGPVNFTAPQPVRNRELARALGRVMGRPSFFPAPSFMVRWVLGEFATAVLKGQRVVPSKLQDCGFTFRYPAVEGALRQILGTET